MANMFRGRGSTVGTNSPKAPTSDPTDILTRQDMKDVLQEVLREHTEIMMAKIQHMVDAGRVVHDHSFYEAMPHEYSAQELDKERSREGREGDDGYKIIPHFSSRRESAQWPQSMLFKKMALTALLSEGRAAEGPFWSRLVASVQFEYSTSLLVMLNAVVIGMEADLAATGHGLLPPIAFKVSEVAFCLCFLLELLIRIGVNGAEFFNWRGDMFYWNMFDTLVVVCQVVDELTQLFLTPNPDQKSNVSTLRLLRILRLMRITRLVRTLRLIEELRTLVFSIANSMKSLFWTLILLAMMIYSCSVLFTQLVTEALQTNPSHAPALKSWFGSLSRTVLTLFEVILGGVSWDEVVRPLIADVSAMSGILFCSYIAFSVFALMNVVTGVFVEVSTRTAKEDQDENFVAHITELFLTDLKDGHHEIEISWEEFQAKLHMPDMEAYFQALNVDTSEAHELFKLLDEDGNGCVSATELIDGLMRLRGTARAKEVGVLCRETRHMQDLLCMQGDLLKKNLDTMEEVLKIIQRRRSNARFSTEFSVTPTCTAAL